MLAFFFSSLDFTETPSVTGDNTQHTLPVTFDTIEDPSVNNLTRSDANCDKTGTCYDGTVDRIFRSFFVLFRFECADWFLFSVFWFV